jgi:glucose-6-phosphate 1-epimerase
MAEAARAGRELFHGLPCWRLSLQGGDSVRVALHGAQVLSWVAGGRERLYLSPRSVFDGQAAIRGGVPLCFPQFNQRGHLPKHGFVRNLPWQDDVSPQLEDRQASLRLRLSDSAATRALWPHAFEMTLTVLLRPASLQLQLELHNTGDQSLQFTGALHSYLRVDDLPAIRLEGLDGRVEWDAVSDRHGRAPAGGLHFSGEFDRVYDAAAHDLRLCDGANRLRIAQSPSLANTVVWNPGAAKCAGLSDMPGDGWRHMLCVEAAQVMPPVTVAAGARWQGWQRFTQE